MGHEGIHEVNDLMIERDLRLRTPVYIVAFIDAGEATGRRLLRFLGSLSRRYAETALIRVMYGNEHPSFVRNLELGPLPALALWCRGLFFARWFGVIDPSALRHVVEALSTTLGGGGHGA